MESPMFYGETRATLVAPLSTPVARMLMQVAGFAVKAARAIENRRALAQLGQLDDHMLRDIGVTRADLNDAASEPMWRDGTQVLILRTTERRAAARMKAREQGLR
ncbi:MAG: hypothetical protein B7X99_17135 [Rhizobiales bacterium 17-65-6]|nr:MAG: hypothetical protein B7Z30_03605 [Rhizobiales bacterium 12-68-15]OYX89266.1 MAG: hypothetical protein B7Y84_05900 [Azorhizobium sp. 32-67-21]OYZ90390.1 MAG: hypothetical protein B7X99_17135 [Rhizobiales bacterium 17-65-6]